jgi:crotonobetainyl-CoA:carnitine CoA-transferase CaiB-like acyl-CoA transferase
MPTCPVSIHRCKTGWIGITPLTPAQWQSFCDMLDLPELASDPALQVPRDRYPLAARMEAAFDARFPERTADEWAAIGREQKVPMVIVPDALGILDHPIFNARESFAQFEHGERTFRVPRTPLRLERSVPRRALDEIGDASEDQTGNPTGDQTGTSSAAPLAPTICGDDTSPLAGVRIADFSMGWAGPLATRMLADLGAEVVKIEAGRYPDWWRSVDWAPQAIADKQYEQSRNFCALNRGKKSISLDLTEQRGRALARAFVERCDIVVENQAAGVMPRLGLGYDDLASDRDDLIMLSMSAFGSGNAWSATRAYGSVLEQGSGLPSFAGHPADPPTMAHIAYGDPVGGIYGAASLLSALYFRQRMGHGQWINNTQIEAMLPFTTPALLIRQALGREPTRWGNRHPQMAPHGCFACADDAEGEDQWLSVSVTDDASWSALARVLGGEDWLQDTSLASVAGRRKREGEIEQAISQWCHGQDAGDAARALQAAGVAAAKVQRSGDVTSDPHLHSRSFFYLTERPYIGAQAQAGLPIRRDRERYPMRGIAPFLGGNSHEILCGLLGVTEDDYEALESSQVVSLQPTQLRQG